MQVRAKQKDDLAAEQGWPDANTLVATAPADIRPARGHRTARPPARARSRNQIRAAMTLPRAPRHNPLTPAQVDTARKIAADSVLLATLPCPKVSADVNNKANQDRADRAAMAFVIAASRITAIGDAVTNVNSNTRSCPGHVQLEFHAGSQLSAPTSKVTGKRALKRLTVPEDVLLGSAASVDLFATQRLKPNALPLDVRRWTQIQ